MTDSAQSVFNPDDLAPARVATAFRAALDDDDLASPGLATAIAREAIDYALAWDGDHPPHPASVAVGACAMYMALKRLRDDA